MVMASTAGFHSVSYGIMKADGGDNVDERLDGLEKVVDSLSEEIETLKDADLAVIGSTPLRVERDTPGVVLRSDGECTYSIKSDTVVNTDSMTFVEKDITLTHNSIYELVPAATVTQ